MRDLQGPWTDLCEILPHVLKHVHFINAGPKVWGSAPKKIWGKKQAKFGTISDTSPLCARISPKQIEIFKACKPGALQRSLPRSTKKLVNFGPLITEI